MCTCIKCCVSVCLDLRPVGTASAPQINTLPAYCTPALPCCPGRWLRKAGCLLRRTPAAQPCARHSDAPTSTVCLQVSLRLLASCLNGSQCTHRHTHSAHFAVMHVCTCARVHPSPERAPGPAASFETSLAAGSLMPMIDVLSGLGTATGASVQDEQRRAWLRQAAHHYMCSA
jgi:hypothetical protein